MKQNKHPLRKIAAGLALSTAMLTTTAAPTHAALAGRQAVTFNVRNCINNGGLARMNVFTDKAANWWSGRAVILDTDSGYADIRGVTGTFTVTIHSVCANGSWAKYTATIQKNNQVQWELTF